VSVGFSVTPGPKRLCQPQQRIQLATPDRKKTKERRGEIGRVNWAFHLEKRGKKEMKVHRTAKKSRKKKKNNREGIVGKIGRLAGEPLAKWGSYSSLSRKGSDNSTSQAPEEPPGEEKGKSQSKGPGSRPQVERLKNARRIRGGVTRPVGGKKKPKSKAGKRARYGQKKDSYRWRVIPIT